MKQFKHKTLLARASMMLIAMLCFLGGARAQSQTFDFEDNQIPSGWTNDQNYPWVVVTDAPTGFNGTYCIKSSNSGVGSSTSSIEFTFNFTAAGTISFRGGCWGEGTSSVWDKCLFFIDGTEKLRKGALASWDYYSFEVEAGEHTFKWSYSKDGSVDPTIDAFFVDDVTIRIGLFPSPTDLMVTDITKNSAKVSWTAPESSGITGYTYQYKKASEDSWISDETTTTSVTLNGLTSGTTYNFQVKTQYNSEYSDWATTNFTTDCDVITTYPWSENFDGYTVASAYTPTARTLPVCWNAINTSTYSSYAVYPSIYNYGSSPNCLRMYSAYSSYSDYDPQNQYAILPPMENLAGKQITLQAKGYNTNSTFKIGTMTNPTDVSTFTEISTQSLTTSYQEFEYIIPSDATASYVAIMIEAATAERTTNCVYIDDIVIREAPSCLKPTDLNSTNITENSAELSWTAGGSETEWTIYYKKTTDENYIEVTDVTENPYTLEGLNAATTYQFYVVANCSDTDTSDPSSAYSFTTDCGVITSLPWTENFDSYTGSTSSSAPSGYPNDEMPICWRFLNRSETSSTYPLVFISSNSGYPVSGKCLFFKSSKTTPLYAVLPTFEDDIAGLQLTFTYRNEGTSESNGTLIVGYMTDPTDATTFTAVQTCDRTTTLTEKEVMFTDAPTGSYIAFMYQGGSSDNYYLSIDNVKVDYIPACIKPTGVTASNVTAHEATISWTSEAEAWQIQVGDEDPINVTTNPYTLTGLAAETAYSVKVRTNCGGTYSEWTNPVSFTTTIACPAPTVTVSNITTTTAMVSCTNTEADHFNVMLGEELIGNNVAMPYTLTELEPSTSYTVKVQALCGGEDGESEWSSGTTFMTADNCPDGMVCIGTGTSTSNYLPAYSFYKYGYTQQIYTANEIGMDGQISSIEFKNTGAEKTMTCNIYMTATTKTDFVSTSDWVPLSDDNLVFSGEITFTVGEWTTIELDNPFDYDGTSNLLVTVANVSGTYSNSPHMACLTFPATNQALYSYRDQPGAYDITAPDVNGTRPSFKNRVRFAIGEPAACAKPKNLEVSEIGPRSAKLSWSPGAEEQSAWQICVNNDETNPITANINPFTLTGLTPETEYTVKVRANCGDDGYSEWSNAVTFTTSIACPAPTSVVASNITPTSATISWTGFADSYEMEYCIGDGFDFDDGTLQGWTNLIVNEEGGQWIHSNNNQGGYDYTSLAHGGTGFAMCYSFIDNVGAYDTDAYLISPQNYLITDGASLHFWYDMANDTYPENFEVCIATTDNPTTSDDFTSIWSLSNAKGNGGEKTNVRKRNTRYDNWREVTIDLSDYAGQSIWIAFHDVNEDMYEVWIDDITINSGQNWIPVEGTITDTQYTLTGLNPETSYMVRVRAIYDGEGESAWAVTSFKTLGEAMINFAAEGYATYYNSQKDVVLPDGMQAKIVTEGTSDGTLTYENIADGNIVHAGNAMLLQVSVATAANSPISIGLATPSAAAISGTNLLHGSDTRVDITTLDDYSADNYYYYMLSYDQNGENIGWYWDKDNTDGTGFWSGAHKAWLVLPKSLFQGSGAPFLGLPGWEDTTGIVPVGVNPEDGEWYTLQGLKIGKKPSTKGVYIHNGKKVLIP
jgi:chitodextrinase